MKVSGEPSLWLISRTWMNTSTIRPTARRLMHGGKALDDAGILQRLEAPRARRRRQADLLRQLGDRLASVALQDIEHLDLELVELRHFHSTVGTIE